MKPRIVELYYSISELCFLLRFSDSTIRKRVKDGDFSTPGEDGLPDRSNILDVQGDLRVPASGVNWFLSQNALRSDPGTKARNKAELARKLNGRAVEAHG